MMISLTDTFKAHNMSNYWGIFILNMLINVMLIKTICSKLEKYQARGLFVQAKNENNIVNATTKVIFTSENVLRNRFLANVNRSTYFALYFIVMT